MTSISIIVFEVLFQIYFQMYFHFSLGDVVLFEFWKVNSYGALISSMIGIFIAAMLYEGLKYFR